MLRVSRRCSVHCQPLSALGHQLRESEAVAPAFVIRLTLDFRAARHAAEHDQRQAVLVQHHLRPPTQSTVGRLSLTKQAGRQGRREHSLAPHARHGGAVRELDRGVVRADPWLGPDYPILRPSVPALLQLRLAPARQCVDQHVEVSPVVLEHARVLAGVRIDGVDTAAAGCRLVRAVCSQQRSRQSRGSS